MNKSYKLAAAHIGVGIAAFAVASLMGVLQGLSIADVNFPQRSESLYYLSVTAHGVLMALVFTTFFIMGLGYAMCQESLGRIVGAGPPGSRSGWRSSARWWRPSDDPARAELGALHVLSADAGASAVLHRRHAAGRRVLDLGRRDDRQPTIVAARSTPACRCRSSMHGTLANIIIWYLATTGLAIEVLGMLIPWSLGWVETIDPLLARTYFWWFGHPLVYFWLLPAYVLWYAVLPRIAGGRLFSDSLARMVFILFVLLSTPVGFHHQFADPGHHRRTGSSRTPSPPTRSCTRAWSRRSPSSRRSRSPDG